METQPAFIRADCTVHLNPEATVDVNIAVVINPRNTEHDDTLRLDDALNDFGLSVLGPALEHKLE